ncbi:MAG TPA: hypothetical protein VKK81_23110 [Candidatus Binatia bacterium]|nr:hypothetical protein [Candidatus Binatia bacterium]
MKPRCWYWRSVQAVFLVVGGLLAYIIIRFRHRPADTSREPPQVYGSNQIELA